MSKSILHKGNVLDDFVIDKDGHHWTQLCTDHAAPHDSRNISYAPGYSICGVKGCNKESDWYLDIGQKEDI